MQSEIDGEAVPKAMNQTITYALRRNVAAEHKGRACKIALAIIRFPDGTGTTLAIPEELIATIPEDRRDDFIQSEVEAIVGYEVTRQ